MKEYKHTHTHTHTHARTTTPTQEHTVNEETEKFRPKRNAGKGARVKTNDLANDDILYQYDSLSKTFQ